jgi:hypothetical protein
MGGGWEGSQGKGTPESKIVGREPVWSVRNRTSVAARHWLTPRQASSLCSTMQLFPATFSIKPNNRSRTTRVECFHAMRCRETL